MRTSSQLFGIWLLEQGSNLQALRHLINSQARLPIPPSRKNWWNERDSNPHLPLARRGLSQLSYHPMVDPAGIEPAASSLRARRSAQ